MSAGPRPGRAGNAAKSVTKASVTGEPAGTARNPRTCVRGDDASLVGQHMHDLLGILAGEHDAAMVVEEHGGSGGDELDVGAVVDALTTPPFLADRRIVVLRDAGRLAAADAARLVACLDDPLPGVTLVLVAGGGTIPAALVKATERHGTVVDTAVGTGRARTQWLVDRLHEAPVKLDARAGSRLGEHLGGDVSRLRGLLDALRRRLRRGRVHRPREARALLGGGGLGGAVGSLRRHRRR